MAAFSMTKTIFRFYDENEEYGRFSHRTTVSARKPASFSREKRDTPSSLSTSFCKNIAVSKQVKNTIAVLSIRKKAQLPAIRITEQAKLLTKGKINRPGYKYFQLKTGSQISFSSSS